VEGAELLVLERAKNLIRKDRPVIVFEYGIGGSDYYEPDPARIFTLISDYGLKVSLLERWLNDLPAMDVEEFKNQYFQRLNFFFVAYP